jgi:O-antigen ligase
MVLSSSLLGGHLNPMAGITLFFLLAVLLFLMTGPALRLRKDELSSLLFAFFSAASVFYAGDKWGAMLFSGSFVAGALFYVTLRNAEGWAPLLLKTILAGGCIAALSEALRQVNLVPYALFYNLNPFSGFLTPLVPLSFYLYLKEKEERYAAASALLVFANFVSASRTGVLAMLLALLAILLYLCKQKDRAAIRALLLAIVIGFGSFLIFSQAKDLLMIKGVEGMLDKPATGILQRSYLLKVTLGLIAQAPVLGHGLNSFTAVMSAASNPYVVERAIHAHSLYLNILAELGVVGLALFFLFLWFVLRGPLNTSFFLKVALLSFLFHNIVEYNFPAPPFQMLFYLLCAAIVTEKEPAPAIVELKGRALRITSSLVAFYFVVVHLFPVIGFLLLGRADAAFKERDAEKTLRYLQTSTYFGYSASLLHERTAEFISHVYFATNMKDQELRALAEKSYVRALALNRMDGDLYVKMADFYAKSGQPAEAERALRVVIEKYPFYQQYRLAMARFLVGQARYVEAIQTLEMSNRFLKEYAPLDPSRLDVLSGMAFVWEKTGDTNRALSYSAEAKRLQDAIDASANRQKR